MPIFEYKCSDCGAVSEFLTGVAQDETDPACSSCGGTKLSKLFSVMSFSVKGDSAAELKPCGAGPGETCENCHYPN